MATRKEFLQFILDQLAGLEEITRRAMMGEYILYDHGKIAAYLCDDRLLVKPVEAACRMLPGARREAPYEGAKEMLVVEDVENRALLQALFRAMYPELPAPKCKKSRKSV